MKKWLSHIIYIALLAVVTSCNSDLVEESSLQADKVNVTFTLAMGEPASASRAAETRADESGNTTEYDNKIDAKGLQVVFYAVEGNGALTYLNKVNNIIAVQDGTDKKIYHIMGNLSIDKKYWERAGLKIMVFANCETSISAETDLAALAYEQATTSTSGIPMWGVLTTDKLTFSPGRQEDLGTIDVLRAMAKVEVTLDSKMTDYSLTSVKLKNYNHQGYNLPKGYAEAVFTTNVNYIEIMNALPDLVTEDLPFSKNGENSYVVYIPEYVNTNDKQATIEVALKKGNEEVKLSNPYIYFKDYSSANTGIFNIIRNYNYQFKIKSAGTIDNVNLEIEYQAVKWVDKGNHDITFN